MKTKVCAGKECNARLEPDRYPTAMQHAPRKNEKEIRQWMYASELPLDLLVWLAAHAKLQVSIENGWSGSAARRAT